MLSTELHLPHQVVQVYPEGPHTNVNDAEFVRVDGICVLTKEPCTVRNIPVEGLVKWSFGAFIQDALPSLSPAHREFLISGISPDGWLHGAEEKLIDAETKAREEFYAPYEAAIKAGVQLDTECDDDCEVCLGDTTYCPKYDQDDIPF